MYRKVIICLTVCIGFINSNSLAAEPNDYLIPGRALLFNGTLTGVRSAYQVFDNGLKDNGCAQCQTSKELKFFHALSKTAMLLVRDDGNSIDSVFELMQKFGITISGQYWAPYYKPSTLDFNEVRNQHNVYQIPDNAPDINDFKNILDTSFIPEITSIISDLNSISDSPSDRFRIYLSTDELRIFYPSDYAFEEPLTQVEVDYGEVFLLKGILTALKAQLEFKAAYDIYISPNDKLIEKLYGNTFKINEDILLTHPEILKVLPTLNDSNDGKAALVQIKQDWIDAINYYFDMVEYIRSEEDPQEDDFIYIDPSSNNVIDEMNKRLTTLRDSLLNDTIAALPWETTKTYSINEPGSTPWTLTLTYNLLGYSLNGSFVALDGNKPGPWYVDYFNIEDGNLYMEMHRDAPGWGGAVFNSTLSQDGNTITNGVFEYWGSSFGTINNLSGQTVDVEVLDVNIDLNPIFGSTARYPNPVNPRDLLPEFDQWNAALPGTVGHGLGNDPTLGGILPQTTQYDWQKEFNLQPGGLIYLDYISSSKITIDGNMADWDANQLILNDISGDTDPDKGTGVDIKNLYMAYDRQNLYCAIGTYDTINTGEHFLGIALSYLPNDANSVRSIKIQIRVYNGTAIGRIRYKDIDGNGNPYWRIVSTFSTGVACGQNTLEFKVPFSSMPDDLPGRFISVASNYCQSADCFADLNMTHLKIGGVETISGTVSYDGFKGDPIFVQAYIDPQDPEGSVIATTMITAPGRYTLEGIGPTWQIYVRAFTPLFGFSNPFESGAFQIQTATSVFMTFDDLENIDIALNYPVELKKNVSKAGEIDSETREVDWYYFDAVAGGTYTIHLTRGTAPYACISLYDRDAESELVKLIWQQTQQQIIWTCPESGRYYVEAANGYYQPSGGTYQIQMTSDITCPQADIASAKWVGVQDCTVNFYDLAVLVSHWLDNCSSPYWCDKADFNQSGSANFSDFAVLANEWMSMGI